MVFTDFKFKIALYEGTTLRPFAMPNTANETDVMYNRTANLYGQDIAIPLEIQVNDYPSLY